MGGPDILFYFEQSQASSLSGLLQPFILLDGHESGVCVCVYIHLPLNCSNMWCLDCTVHM